MIQSFADRETEQVFEGKHVRRYQQIAKIALRKLVVLDNTARLEDLKQPPGNRLEALKGDRAGQFSIRINAQYRICFRWSGDQPHEVGITDYH